MAEKIYPLCFGSSWECTWWFVTAKALGWNACWLPNFSKKRARKPPGCKENILQREPSLGFPGCGRQSHNCRSAESLSPSATYAHCDVSKEEDVKAVVDLAMEKHGQLDIMYNNAGIYDALLSQRVEEYDMEQYDRVMNVNVRAVMLGINHAARVMIPRKKGCIISTSSLASIVGGSAPYSYTASKHAAIGLTKNGAAELGKYGIRVNAVSGVATPFSVKQMRRGGDSSSVISETEKAAIEGFCNRMGNLQGPTLTPLRTEFLGKIVEGFCVLTVT